MTENQYRSKRCSYCSNMTFYRLFHYIYKNLQIQADSHQEET